MAAAVAAMVLFPSYADEGVDVDVQHSGGGGEQLQLLDGDEVQITTRMQPYRCSRGADPCLPLVPVGLIGYGAHIAPVRQRRVGRWEGEESASRTLDRYDHGFEPRVKTQAWVDVYLDLIPRQNSRKLRTL